MIIEIGDIIYQKYLGRMCEKTLIITKVSEDEAFVEHETLRTISFKRNNLSNLLKLVEIGYLYGNESRYKFFSEGSLIKEEHKRFVLVEKIKKIDFSKLDTSTLEIIVLNYS